MWQQVSQGEREAQILGVQLIASAKQSGATELGDVAKKEATISSALAMAILSKISTSLLKQPGGLANEGEIIVGCLLLQKAP